MAEDAAIESFELKGLDQIIKALKIKPPVVRIGILGSKNSRTDSQSNATIGAAHEFGTSTIPQRSFLRVPLTNNIEKELENSNAFDNDVLNNVIKEGNVKPWLNKIGALAKKIVLQAFDEQGPGWAGWKKKGYTSKTGMILQNTTQLRDSIDWDVK